MASTRFRRSASPKGALGGLSNLGNLIADSRRSKPPGTVGPVAGDPYGIVPDDEDLGCVWKVMNDGKSRTAMELAAVLVDYPDQVEPDDIESLLRLLVTNGFATRQANRGDEFIYTLKKGLSMSSIENKAPTAKRGPQSALEGLSSDGKVNLAEGIMVCLWKVMADHKGRNQTQIISILSAYGINGEVAKDAFIRAKVNLKWFDWHGSGQSTAFKLKKHIKMPAIVETDPLTLRSKQSPGSIRITPATESRLPPFPMAASAPVYTSKARRHVDTPEPALTHEQNAEVVATAATPAVEASSKPVTPAVFPDDPIEVAIWKVMSDYAPYTASEVGVLLETYGHKPGTVRAKISQLFLHDGHWFTRVKDKNAVSGSLEYVYTLRREVPMPGSGEPELPLEPVVQPAPIQKKEEEMPKNPTKATTALAAALTSAQQKAAEAPAAPETPATHAVTTVTSNEPAPILGAATTSFNLAALPDSDLLRFKVTVRNTDYSFAQVEILARELVAAGFGEGKRREAPQGLLQTSHRIGNATFSANELEDLTAQLLSVGFGDNE